MVAGGAVTAAESVADVSAGAREGLQETRAAGDLCISHDERSESYIA